MLQPVLQFFGFSILLAYLTLGLTACQPAISADSPLQERILLVGSGASFPALIYQSWFIALNRDIPALRVNYQSLGSGAGVEQFINETIDFGASDVAMTDVEMAQVSRGVLLLPMTVGSIVLVYNLPGVESGLNLPRTVYSDILLGTITRWDDPLGHVVARSFASGVSGDYGGYHAGPGSGHGRNHGGNNDYWQFQ